MRFIGAVIASLILHALFLQVPMGASQQGKSAFPLPLIDAARGTQVLLITLQSKDEVTREAAEMGKKAHEGGFQQLNDANPAVEAEAEKPLPSAHSAPEKPVFPALAEPQIRYYIRDEVDRPARMIDNINEKDGPLDKALRDTNEHGSLVLELWINDRGWVEKTAAVESTLSEATLGIIREHVERAHFLPARLEHRPVSSRIFLEFQVNPKPDKPSENTL